jgi:hypothetical protein
MQKNILKYITSIKTHPTACLVDLSYKIQLKSVYSHYEDDLSEMKRSKFSLRERVITALCDGRLLEIQFEIWIRRTRSYFQVRSYA